MYGYAYGYPVYNYPGNYQNNNDANGYSWIWIIIVLFIIFFLFWGGGSRGGNYGGGCCNN